MKIEMHGVRHCGQLVPEFDSGERGLGEHKGRIVVQRIGTELCWTRHPSEVIGWRLVCRCTQVRNGRLAVNHWNGEWFWPRVSDPNEHDPSRFRVYAPDELTVDVGELEDVAAVAENVWHQNHIQASNALAAIWAAVSNVALAREELEAAKRAARNTSLARSRVRAAMSLRPDQADYLDRVFAAVTNG
ncbi:MAG: hypothetical protein U0R81_16275 [Mycobacterium sp.]